MALSASSIGVSWRDNSDNELAFIVIRGDGSTWTPGFAGANTTSYIDTGLKPGATYIYLVGAYNSFGGSWATIPVLGTTLSR